MATKLTIKRTDLIKAIKAKAKANQLEFDKLQADAPAQSKFDAALEEMLTESYGKPDTNYGKRGTAAGYTKAGARNGTYLYLGLPVPKVQTLVQPKLFEKELAILEMATDETLSIDDTSDYFSFLK